MGTSAKKWEIFDEAPDLIKEKWEIAQEYAQNAYNMASQAIQSLINIAGALELISTNISIDEITFSPGEISVTPPSVPENLDAEFPAAPSEPTNLIEVVFGQLPDFPDPVSTDPISSGNHSYTSSVITALQQKLLNDLENGGNGINPEIENAIFQREYERSLLTHNETMDRIAAEWSKRGLPLPDGALAAMFMEEEINFTNKRLDVSRDVSIKSFELAQANTHFAIQQAVAMEAQLIGWANNVAERIFRVSEAVVNAQIARYKVLMDGATAQTQAVIEEARGKIEFNRSLIQQYVAQIDAYKSRIQAEATRIDVLIRSYEGQVGAFKAIADFDISKVGLDIKILEARINQAVANAGLQIKDAELRMKNYEVVSQLKIEAQRGIAQIVSQLVAGALSSVSVSASMSADNKASITRTGVYPASLKEAAEEGII